MLHIDRCFLLLSCRLLSDSFCRGRGLNLALPSAAWAPRRLAARGKRMWLLDKMLRNYVSRGELTVIDHKGRIYRYGAPDDEFRPVTVRVADSRVVRDIVRDPGLGAAETYRDGRLIVEQGDILDL